MLKFNCDRTCAFLVECRFRRLLAAVGETRVFSHTVKVKVEYRDADALGRAAQAMGGSILGRGTHDLYAGQQATGFGFKLPGWNFPLVLEDGGQLAFDDFKGRWGNVADLDVLKAKYAVECAVSAAEAQGWMHQRNDDGSLVIFHPDGGSLTVTAAGVVDACGFQGQGCHAASETIAQAMGGIVESQHKPAFYQNEQQIETREAE